MGSGFEFVSKVIKSVEEGRWCPFLLGGCGHAVGKELRGAEAKVRGYSGAISEVVEARNPDATRNLLIHG